MVSVVPESCWLIVAGILGGLILYLTETTVLTPLSSGIFFFIMLPPIIFDAGYFMPNRPFFDHIGTILLFAVVGTIFNTISIGKRRSSDILIMYLCIYYSECRCKSLGLWLDWHLWFWYFTAWNTHILLTDFGGWPRGRFGSVWRSSCWSSTLHYRLWRITPQRCRHSGILKLDLKFIFFFYRVCFFVLGSLQHVLRIQCHRSAKHRSIRRCFRIHFVHSCRTWWDIDWHLLGISGWFRHTLHSPGTFHRARVHIHHGLHGLFECWSVSNVWNTIVSKPCLLRFARQSILLTTG